MASCVVSPAGASGASLGTLTGGLLMAQKMTLGALAAGLLALLFVLGGDDPLASPDFEGEGELTLMRASDGEPTEHDRVSATDAVNGRSALDREPAAGSSVACRQPLPGRLDCPGHPPR